MPPLGIMFFTTLILLRTCESSGKVYISLLKYSNQDDKLADGSKCDFVPNKCDHKFIVCLFTLNGFSTGIPQPELIDKYETETLNETKELPFDKWLGSFLLNVTVMDKDLPFNKDDLVDEISFNGSVNASFSGNARRPHSFHAKARTTLDFKIEVICDKDWYGPKCDQNKSSIGNNEDDDCGFSSNKSQTTNQGKSDYSTSETEYSMNLPASQNSGAVQNTTINPATSSTPPDGTGALVSGIVIVFGSVLVITGFVTWKICQMKQQKLENVTGQNNVELYDLATSVDQQCVMPDDHVYYDINENQPQNGTQNDEGLYEDPDRKDAADVCSVSDDENKIKGDSSSRNSMESVTSEVVLQDNEIYN